MPEMIRRRFGRTELQMPVFSCGGMRYQHGWSGLKIEEIPAESQQNLADTIHRAVELGINHIETARGYGSSEMQLGHVLPKLPRDEIIVQTKVAPMEDPEKFVETFNTSMDMLQLDYVDLLGLHGINNAETLDWAVKPGGCLDAARELQKQGRLRHVGFSTHGPTEIIVRAIQTDRAGGFDYVNLHWYYIFQRNWPAIAAATKRDMGVFIISPTDKGGRLWDPAPEIVDLCKPLHPIVFNDLFCLSRSQVHTLSLGAARPSDFDLHLKVLPLLDEAARHLAPIQTRLGDAMQKAVGVRHAEDMTIGVPEYDRVPGEINVATIAWLVGLTRGWGLKEYAKSRYNLLGNGGHWFAGQNASKLDEVGDHAVRAAVTNAPHIRDVIQLLREAHDLLAGEEVKRLSKSE